MSAWFNFGNLCMYKNICIFSRFFISLMCGCFGEVTRPLPKASVMRVAGAPAVNAPGGCVEGLVGGPPFYPFATSEGL